MESAGKDREQYRRRVGQLKRLQVLRQYKLQKDLSALHFSMPIVAESAEEDRAQYRGRGLAGLAASERDAGSGFKAIQAAEGFERAPLPNAK